MNNPHLHNANTLADWINNAGDIQTSADRYNGIIHGILPQQSLISHTPAQQVPTSGLGMR